MSTDRATDLYGPQGAHVEALIARLRRLSPGEFDAVSEAHLAAVQAARAAKTDPDDPGEPDAVLDALTVCDALTVLYRRRHHVDNARRVVHDAVHAGAPPEVWQQEPGQAKGDAFLAVTRVRAAARHAVSALLVRGHLDPGRYETLTAPLRAGGVTVHPDDAPLPAAARITS